MKTTWRNNDMKLNFNLQKKEANLEADVERLVEKRWI